MSTGFAAPRLKLKRASHHITQLKRGLAKARVDENASAVIGDAVYNLHNALDQAFSILVTSNNNIANDRTSFPFRKTQKLLIKAFEDMKTINSAPDEAVQMELLELRPYQGSNLYELHRLRVLDLHQPITPLRSSKLVNARSKNVFVFPDYAPLARHEIVPALQEIAREVGSTLDTLEIYVKLKEIA